MTDLLVPLAVAITALAASITTAVVGFGSAIILLPVLVWAVGIRDAVPVLTIMQLIGNASRIYLNRKELALPTVGWFALGGVPAAVLGATFFATAPAHLLNRLLGAFLLAAVLFRRTRAGRGVRVGLRGFAPVGAAAGLVSAVVGTGGLVAAPFFLSFGLVKGAYVGSDSLAAAVVHIPKLIVYGQHALLEPQAVTLGATTGAVMVVGSIIGKRILDRLPERIFHILIEAVMVLSGLQFLLFG